MHDVMMFPATDFSVNKGHQRQSQDHRDQIDESGVQGSGEADNRIKQGSQGAVHEVHYGIQGLGELIPIHEEDHG